MTDDDLIRRGDVLRLLQSGAGLTLNGQARRVAALPAVTPRDYTLRPDLQKIVDGAKVAPQWDTEKDRLQPAPTGTTAVSYYAPVRVCPICDIADCAKHRDQPQPVPAMRPETDMEHIARDMREARFPERSERQVVPAETQAAPDVARLVEAAKAHVDARRLVDDTPEFCALVAALAAMEGKP